MSAVRLIPLQNSMGLTADLVGRFPLEGVCGIGTNALTRLGRASSCRRWRARTEKLSEPPQVLCECSEQHLVPRAAQAAQPNPSKRDLQQDRRATLGRRPRGGGMMRGANFAREQFRSLPVHESPEADQRAWQEACRPGFRLKP